MPEQPEQNAEGAPDAAPVLREHRNRLLEGLALALATQSYADTTIADIVREAGVSRRTFYEHFETKAQCFIALYEIASANALQALKSAVDPSRPWQDQVEHALGAFMGYMARNPVLLRTLFVEILGLGTEGLAARRRTHERLAKYLMAVVNAESAKNAGGLVLEPAVAMGVVGGLTELVLQAVEQGRVAQLPALAQPAGRIVRAASRV